jgi:hypothetical protein
MALTIQQQVADTEALFIVWYQTLGEINEVTNCTIATKADLAELNGVAFTPPRSIGFDFCEVRHQPSGEQLRRWIDIYGFDCTERGLRVGLPNLLKITNGIVESDKDALRMIAYLNACIRNIRASFEKARARARASVTSKASVTPLEEFDAWMVKNKAKGKAA